MAVVPTTTGVLEVAILEARNLGSTQTPGRPYCVVEYETAEFVTREGAGTNPSWNHAACFDVTDADAEVRISIWDRACAEHGTSEDFLGSCSVRPTRAQNLVQDAWFKLKGQRLKSIRGDIHVQFRFKAKTGTAKPLSVDDFEVLHLLGKGSYGKVLQVRKRDTGRIYAMKVLRKSLLVARNEVEHALAERQILSMRPSPFIVHIKASFQTAERLYLVLDYVNGGELFFHLERNGPFTEAEAKIYAAEIIIAIDSLHQRNIVYRDLKPENVLLDGNGHIALTDFGLAKLETTPTDGAETFCGTAEYLAPEILKGGRYGYAVDWWSLGVMLFELMVGMPPFFSDNTHLMYKKILFAEVQYPATMSPEARSLLQGLMTREPSERLGCGTTGAAEIKAHPFFADVNWDRIARKAHPPPFKPAVVSESDVSNFDSEYTAALLKDASDSPPDPAPLSASTQARFAGFSYNSATPSFGPGGLYGRMVRGSTADSLNQWGSGHSVPSSLDSMSESTGDV